MLQSRLQALPRRNPTTPAAPAPDLKDLTTESELEESPEDILESFIAHLFPDDAHAWHGDPGQHLLYSSPHYGDLEIAVPSYPEQSNKPSEKATEKEKVEDGANDVDNSRKLFAHFVWNSGLVVAEGVENAHVLQTEGTAVTEAQKETIDIWNVKGESVLELGAGAALPSLICALANASKVTATDHPSSPALKGTIGYNMDHNLSKRTPTPSAEVSIHPHEWGVLTDTFAEQNKGGYSRIIAADCFWMVSQHENITRTMQWFLAPGGKVWIVAGFHTGRAIVAGFFEMALKHGFEIEKIFERDQVKSGEHGEEIRREWLPVRDDESIESRRRWCVVAVLKRKE
ncbi:hypothetical protein N7507_007653 [Penicillium longicatenatum]|nr:hypothetical protein N7507_007653 [Penicillium longicatenatum]